MAVPKRKISKQRGRKRRTHYVATAPQVGECPHCGFSKQPHRVCPNCGFYKERQIVKGI